MQLVDQDQGASEPPSISCMWLSNDNVILTLYACF